MKIHIDNYQGGGGIFSLALDDSTKEELLGENVPLLFVAENSICCYPEETTILVDEESIEKLCKCNNFDAFELYSDGDLVRLYDDSTADTMFFITEKCNSNCIMCPSPEVSRKRGLSTSIDKLITLAGHMPSDVPHVTITGGEPFMAGKDLFRLLSFCQNKFEQTEFLILTNGRIFAVREYCELLYESIPNHCIIAVPIHGSNEKLHDAITQTSGSFKQTYIGLKRLQKAGIKTELRIVVTKNNIDDLDGIAHLIVNSFDKAIYVSIMAMETTGSAFQNIEQVWISYKESFPQVRSAVEILMRAGIDVRLYNYPLCIVDKDMRTLCYKSISEWKRKYAPCCNNCNLRDSCGGLFGGTYKLEKEELKAI